MRILIFIGGTVILGAGIWYFITQREGSAGITAFIDGDSEAISETDKETRSTVYTTEEVAKHAKEADCWTLYDGKVYNLTVFINKHPGGKENILKSCGIDSTDLFNAQHDGAPKPEEMLRGLQIGIIQ